MHLPVQLEVWDSTPVALPPRSRLCSLDPIGVGTPLVEGLSSYIARLADAHAVSVGDLMGRELWPLTSSSLSSPKRGRRPRSHGFHAQTYVINGSRKPSQRVVAAVEKATYRTGLRSLTLLPFDGVLSHQHLFRTLRSWCPACYEEWRTANQAIYEPLLWSFDLVTVCPVHSRSLETHCRACGRVQPPLAVFSRPGYCSQCQQWLGGSGLSRRPMEQDKRRQHNWNARAIGDLLAFALEVESKTHIDVLRANLKHAVQEVSDGNCAAFAQRCKVSRSAFCSHLNGYHLPTLDVLLRICHQISVPIVALYKSDFRVSKQTLYSSGEQQQEASKRRSSDELRNLLRCAASEVPPPSLREIASRWGYKGTERFQQVDAGLCKEISRNFRNSGRSHYWKKPGGRRISEEVDIRKLLEESLASDAPLSAIKIAAQLGYTNEGYLRKRFPELCRAIAEKIAVRQAARISAVEETLHAALNENPVPTLNSLRKRLGYSSSECLRLRFPALCEQILRKRECMRRTLVKELRRKLKCVLSELPAPPLCRVSKGLGICCGHLKKLCPQECAAVSSRYLCLRSETSHNRKTELHAEVAKIVRDLHQQGRCPSLDRVLAVLPPHILRERGTLAEALKAARRALPQTQ